MKKMMMFTTAALMGIVMTGAAMSVSAAEIELDQARKEALEAVGLTEDQVIFKEADEDTDDGRLVYDIDFFVPGEVKYEFDIDVATGAIVEQDIDLWEPDDDIEYAALIKAAGKAAEAEALTEEAGAENVEGQITELQAKMIALTDAGIKADEAAITKCRLDMDDGVLQFEIELKLADGTEYDYEIKASDGTIMDKDIDND